MIYVPKWGLPASRKPVQAKVERAYLIQKLLNQGRSVPEIADDLGITKNAVYLAIRRYGLKIKKDSPKGD